MQIKYPAIIFKHANFSWHTLFTKPLEFVIQIFTGRYCHVAISVMGLIADSTGKGVRMMSVDDWMNEHKGGKAYNKIEVFYFKNKITTTQITQICNFINSKLGQKYSFVEAAFSAIDNSVVKYDDPNRTYCAEFAEDCCAAADIMQPRKNGSKDDPTDLQKRMYAKGLIDKRGIGL